uniref:glycoprotein hormone beta-5 isoform X1 n=2 Tax=Myxine glutinosa TaxID=7769 RepID=UPI00358E8201
MCSTTAGDEAVRSGMAVPRSMLLGLLLCLGTPAPSQALDLRTFVGCAVREFTFSVQKHGCRDFKVTTDACWGRCETWEKPIEELPFMLASQTVCTYYETRYETIQLPNCRPGVNPNYSFPVALSCDCSLCSLDYMACETF